jgi:hypothetical protein
MHSFRKIFLVMVTALVVASCGAGGGPTAGIDRGGITSGPVTGYGSVWVNGSRYQTTTAEIEVNGQPATEKDLKIGQVVVLNSLISGSSLSAERIVYESNLKGPVESVDVIAGSFVALGQEVMVDAGTSFGPGIAPADITGLVSGSIVEVSGLVDTSGQIRATRIDKEDEPYQVQLSGTVALGSGMQFTIGAQLVDYSSAMLDPDYPAGIISDGDQVRVIVAESVSPQFGASGEILATEIAYRGSPVDIEDGEEGDVEGLITDFTNEFSFRLAGFAIVTNAQTEYSGGTGGDLGDNIRIEAEGVFDASGVLIAEEIEFRQEGEARIEATVDAEGVTSIENGSGQTTYAVPVFGVSVETTLLTAVEDKRDEIRPFSPGDLEPGDFLKIEGSWDGSKLIATRLERIDGEDKFKIRGLITDALSPAFTLLGKSVLTDATDTSFEVGGVEGLTSLEFFAAISVCLPSTDGCAAEAAWDAAGSGLIADDVELKD